MVLDAAKCSFHKLHQSMKKALKVLQCNAFKAFLLGTPEGTRTPNIQNRNLTLYPIELRALINRSIIIAGLPRVVKCYFKNFFLFSNPFWNGPRHVCCLPKNVLPPRRHISLNLKFECGAAEAAFSDPFVGEKDAAFFTPKFRKEATPCISRSEEHTSELQSQN